MEIMDNKPIHMFWENTDISISVQNLSVEGDSCYQTINCMEDIRYIDYELEIQTKDKKISGVVADFSQLFLLLDITESLKETKVHSFFEDSYGLEKREDDSYLLTCGFELEVVQAILTKQELKDLHDKINQCVLDAITQHNKTLEAHLLEEGKNKDIREYRLFQYESDDSISNMFSVGEEISFILNRDGKLREMRGTIERIGDKQIEIETVRETIHVSPSELVDVFNQPTEEEISYSIEEMAEQFVYEYPCFIRNDFLTSDIDTLQEKYSNILINRFWMCREEHGWILWKEPVKEVQPYVRPLIEEIQRLSHSFLSVSELFQQVSADDVIQELKAHHALSDIDLLAHRRAFLEMQTILPDLSLQYICYGILMKEEEETYMDISMMNWKELKEDHPCSYAIEFNEWKENLGYSVSLTSLQEFSKPYLVSELLYEFTFLGCEEENVETQRDILIDRKKEIDQAIETGDHSKFVSFHSVEEMAKELGIDTQEDDVEIQSFMEQWEKDQNENQERSKIWERTEKELRTKIFQRKTN